MNKKSTGSARTGTDQTCVRDDMNLTGVRGLVQRFSRGNVNLQIGRYASKKEIDKRRKAVTEFNFAD